MSTFLQELAQRLLDANSNDLSKLVVMFPSLRARVFFNDAIEEITKTTTWQPHYTSIDEVMSRASGLQHGERIRLISELYKIYSDKDNFPNEKFDHFYHWGDMLITDFDMIDKYIVDADALLTNITDLKVLDADLSYLSPKQERIIKFWSSVYSGESLSQQKQRFLEVWKALPRIYKRYRERLIELGIGYPGLIYRTTAELIINKQEVDIEPKHYVIAGFNALSKSEQILFDYLSKSEHGAEFYWDYDNYYVSNHKIENHEAGMFLRNNIKEFPSPESLSHDNFTKIKKQFVTTACVSNIAQVKHLPTILNSIPKEELNKQTAIVLTDENLLTPLLHSLPKSIDKVNVTMGYPLKNSLVYSFIEALISLQAHSRQKESTAIFYHKDVTWMLSHPFIVDIYATDAKRCTKDIFDKHIINIEKSFFNEYNLPHQLFVKVNDWKELSNYIIEALNHIMTKVSEVEEEPAKRSNKEFINIEHLRIAKEEIIKLTHSAEQCDIEIPTDIFTSLLRRHLQTISIPYEGEPLEGIQVLGILETRNVDFKNVIILSMTDANFPGNHTDKASFIPYNLRFAYDMPTPEHHEAMYAYYFYRLLQRAERVNMLYCSRADKKSTGECSRYIYQLDFESGYTIQKNALGVDLCIEDKTSIEIPKGEKEMEALMQYTDNNEKPTLSPTALFRYVQCPLKFYFHSIAKLHSRQELTDKMDALTIGRILHKSVEDLYKNNNIVGTKNPGAEIEKLRKNEIIEPIVDNNIGEMLFNKAKVTTADYSGDTLLVRDIIVKYIRDGILRYDASRSGYTVKHLEEDIFHRFPISSGLSVKFSGIADRIDILENGSRQIIDYKSGYKPHLEFDSIEALFKGSDKQRVSNIIQTFLYSMFTTKDNGYECTPSLFYASRMIKGKDSDEYSPLITMMKSAEPTVINSYSMIAKEFEEQLKALLDEMFDPEIPFKQSTDTDSCTNCDYKKICKRENEHTY